MSAQIKNLLIGLFVIAASCIVIFILMFLHPNVGNNGKLLKVRFVNIDKVTVGTRVTYGGKPVGEVVGIHEVEFGREGRKDSYGHIYLYELDLRVDSSVNVYNSDEVSLRTSGLLGERNVEITPIAPKKNVELKQVDDKVIFALETPGIEDTLKQVEVFASKFARTLDSITDTFYRIRDQRVIENINQAAKGAIEITGALNRPQEIEETLDNLLTLTRRANKSWTTVDNALNNIDLTARNANAFIQNIALSEGTFHKLFTKDDLYLRVNSILGKTETILDDINHYGLLFSSDKGWQRLRARRLNLLQKLSTPQEFRNYFNDEVDQISTSISRVSMVIERAGSDDYCYDRMQNPEFTKVFSELMRRVKMLEEEIRLYNTQVVESETIKTELQPPMPYCLPSFCNEYTW
jgi:phospholipid/cholesterol/gamma-HCH transport system substrate-binding protein